MDTAIVYDCEFLTAEGALGRYWCGPDDPDPMLVQIGAVRLGLAEDFPLLERFACLVDPRDREGRPAPVDPFFTELTGIAEAAIRAEGLGLAEALAAFDRFSGGAMLWSWGKDELNMMGISCYVAGIAPPIPVGRFGNVCRLLRRAGVPEGDVAGMRSNAVARYFGVEPEGLRAHDALDDALSVAHALRHLLAGGRLAPEALARP